VLQKLDVWQDGVPGIMMTRSRENLIDTS